MINMSEMNSEIREAIKASDMETARRLLRDALAEANAETYYLASLVALDAGQKQEFLEKSLTLDPFYQDAYDAINSIKQSNNISDMNQPSSSEEPSQHQAESIVLPEATIIDSGEVYGIPHSKSSLLSSLPKDMKIGVISRDPLTNWANITFVNSIGRRAFCWTPVTNLESFSYQGQSASLDDLTVSQLEFNSREEIDELKKIGTDPDMGCRHLFAWPAGFMPPLVILMWLFPGSINYPWLFTILGMVIGLLLTAIIMNLFTPKEKPHLSDPVHGFSESQLSAARREKLTNNELAFEQQQQLLLTSIAGNMATRLVPDRQIIVEKKL